MCIERGRGFTFVELLIFMVVVGVGLAGILSVLNITARHSADPVWPKQAQAIAEALMEEIQSKDFSPPGVGNFTPTDPPTAAERANFDDVLDFDNYGSGLAGIFDVTGTAIPSLAGYSALVGVAHPGAALNDVATADIWVVTVSVTDPGGTAHVYTSYRLNYD